MLEFSILLHSRPEPAKECREDSRRGVEVEVMNTETQIRLKAEVELH